MRARRSPSTLAFILAASIAIFAGCEDDADDRARLVIESPVPDEVVSDCTAIIQFSFDGGIEGEPVVRLDHVPVEVVVAEIPSGLYRAAIPADELTTGEHLVEVIVTRASDGVPTGDHVSFEWAPNARAYEITDPTELITGPLAHNRVGDFILESCTARFAVQAGGQRDLYSVGQYGGNLIDAELIGHPGLDNFLEVSTMVNVETVVNAQTVFVVNDGADGEAAVVRACGPDDLLDFVNPSSQVSDLGIPFPAELNDNDQTVEGCTDFAIEVFDRHIAMTTTFTNTGVATISLLSGDWMNSAGELDTLGTPNPGVGPALTNELGVFGFFGFDEARGVDYSYTTLSDTPGSYVVISGVTVILHDRNVLAALLGAVSGEEVLPGETYVLQRFFGVGDGSGSNAVDLAASVKGLDTGRLEGCVTVAGDPAPAAVVTVGIFAPDGTLTDLSTSFVTDDDGCYSGLVPTPAAPTPLGAVAAREGTPYQGNGLTPEIESFNLSTDETLSLDFDLPATGSLHVTAVDETGQPLPVRISVVGFDASPPIIQPGNSLPGFGGADLGLFLDPDDSHPFGIVDAVHTGAGGEAEFDLEPGTYRVVVSRGTEYSMSDHAVTIAAGAQSEVNATIAAVLDTAGFVSSDFHVHGINSADSRVSHRKRAEGYAGEGVDNIVMTDHHVHTDLDATIAALALTNWVSSSIGEEITTFDYGHFNAYPLTIDPTMITGGSTDWAGAAPPGEDFPSHGNYNATPAEIFDLATNGARSTPDTTIQVNHIGSHFNAMRIDTKLEPPSDDLDLAARTERRLPATLTNLFHPFPALELWNGHSRGAQADFIEDRIGVWFNLLNQGYPTTFIADTDSHRHDSLRMAGARTWTAAAPGSDSAGTVDEGEVGRMVEAGKATGGQGLFITTVLREVGGSGEADLTYDGSTTLDSDAAQVELEIRVQAPIWAAFDTIEIYANAETVSGGEDAPYQYSATPTRSLAEGDCDPATTGDGDFDVTVIDVVPAVDGAERLEVTLTETFAVADATWFVVVAKGTDGACPATFPVFPASLAAGSNSTADDLMDGNVGEAGVMALGATNALYYAPLPR